MTCHSIILGSEDYIQLFSSQIQEPKPIVKKVGQRLPVLYQFLHLHQYGGVRTNVSMMWYLPTSSLKPLQPILLYVFSIY